MSKPRVDPTFGISSEDVLIPTERHPTCRQREARPGFGTERENLAGDAKGKGASGSNREAEITDAPERDALPCSSAEAAVMAVERRGQAIGVELGQPVRRDSRLPLTNERSLRENRTVAQSQQKTFCPFQNQ